MLLFVQNIVACFMLDPTPLDKQPDTKTRVRTTDRQTDRFLVALMVNSSSRYFKQLSPIWWMFLIYNNGPQLIRDDDEIWFNVNNSRTQGFLLYYTVLLTYYTIIISNHHITLTYRYNQYKSNFYLFNRYVFKNEQILMTFGIWISEW